MVSTGLVKTNMAFKKQTASILDHLLEGQPTFLFDHIQILILIYI